MYMLQEKKAVKINKEFFRNNCEKNSYFIYYLYDLNIIPALWPRILPEYLNPRLLLGVSLDSVRNLSPFWIWLSHS